MTKRDDMIEQAKDAYTWFVVCKDGTPIAEYDDTRPDGRGFAEVDGTQVKTLELLPCLPFDDVEHRVAVPDGATPVFFRRRTIELRLEDEQQTARPAIHCIGWKRDEQAVYLFVMADGSTLLSSDLQAI